LSGPEAPADGSISPPAVLPPVPGPNGIAQVTPKQFAELLESHFRIVAVGFSAANPMFPAPVLWTAIAEAFGNVLSGATQGPDIMSTLSIRQRFGEIVIEAIRSRYPAMAPANPAALLALLPPPKR